MDSNDAKLRIEELTALIRYHNNLYYNKDAPEISDVEYDSYFSELVKLECEYPDLCFDDSPTQKIGGTVLPKFESFTHPYRMLGLSNITNEDELIKFDERIQKDIAGINYNYSVEYKLDGLAVELIYHNGAFTIGSTRGDGVVGENITENLKMVQNIPFKLKNSIKGRIIIRGEAVIHKDDFSALNSEREKRGEKLFSNPRNASAGSLRQLDSSLVKNRRIRFYAYQVISESTELIIKTHSDALDWLNNSGLETVTGRWLCGNILEVQEIYKEVEKNRENISYEIDGLVVKINEYDLQDRLGEVSRSPRWAVAYKFKPQEVLTRLNDIKLQTSRFGVFTPVALVEPVKVGGVTVSRVTLHNTKRIGNEKVYVFPENCPYCKTKLKVDNNDVFINCPNNNCKARRVEEIIHFISKPGFNIEGLGEEWVRILFEKNIISDASDLFLLDVKSVINLERMGEKSAQNLINSINKSRKISYVNFIYALGIKSVGVSLAELLTEHFPKFSDLTKAKKEHLEEINEIGPAVALAICDYFFDLYTINFLEKLFKNGVSIVYEKKKIESNKLNGKTFVFTGKLSAMSRDEAKRIAVKNGGKVLSSVSKNLDYLVVGEDPGSKLTRANELGVKVISEEDFLKMV
jgi:DNA ligase (NAD+)